MKTNKIIAIALAALLSASALAACGSKEAPKQDTKNPTTQNTENSQTENTVDPATKEEAKKLADEIVKKARDGEDFYSLVEQYGEDPGMVNNPAGYLFTYGAMVPEFEEASFALEVGEISDPVETTYGYHVIKKLPLDLDPTSDEYLNVASEIASPKLLPELDDCIANFDIVYTDAFNALDLSSIGTPKQLNPDEIPEGETIYPAISNYDWKHDASELMFTINGIPVTFGELRYYTMTYKPYVDGGNDSYWTDETKVAFKNDILDQLQQRIGIKLLALSEKYGITLGDEDYAEIDAIIADNKAQFGEDGFVVALDESFMDEALYRFMLEYDSYTKKLLLANTSDKEIEDNYVRVQHVLVAFESEEEEAAE